MRMLRLEDLEVEGWPLGSRISDEPGSMKIGLTTASSALKATRSLQS